MKVLVTGSEGVFAQQAIIELLANGHVVTGVDNLSKYNEVKNTGQYELIQGDLTDYAFVTSLFNDSSYDIVFHFAALIYGVLWYDKYPAEVLGKNITMTSNLLLNHKSIGKFVYISSSMVYEKTGFYPSKEQDTDYINVMSTDYGFSKYACERLVEAYHKQYELPYLIWRPFNVFDINEKISKDEGKGHVFSDLVRKILIDQQMPVKLLGNGEQTRTFIDIRDAAYAIANLSDQIIGRYNLGTEREITIKELAIIIADTAIELDLLSSSYNLQFETTNVHINDVKRRKPDTSKLQAHWSPRITIEQSVKAFLTCLL